MKNNWYYVQKNNDLFTVQEKSVSMMYKTVK